MATITVVAESFPKNGNRQEGLFVGSIKGLLRLWAGSGNRIVMRNRGLQLHENHITAPLTYSINNITNQEMVSGILTVVKSFSSFMC